MEKVEKILEEIKKLIILQLYRGGATTSEIGELLRVSYKTIERILPAKKERGREQNKKNIY
jgi:transposase